MQYAAVIKNINIIVIFESYFFVNIANNKPMAYFIFFCSFFKFSFKEILSEIYLNQYYNSSYIYNDLTYKKDFL